MYKDCNVCIPATDAVNCSGVECGPGEACVQPDGYDEPVCLCDYAYTYNPNTRACERKQTSAASNHLVEPHYSSHTCTTCNSGWIREVAGSQKNLTITYPLVVFSKVAAFWRLG